MKTKAQKANEARKTAEAVKAARKAQRLAKGGSQSTVVGSLKKGKSMIPQSKTKTKR